MSNPLLMLGGGGEECLSSVMVGKEEVVVTDAVEAVSSSGLVRLDCSVRTRLCALSKCEAIEVDMVNPKDWSKWLRGSITLCEPQKNSWGREACQMEFARPKLLYGTFVLRADSSQMLAFGLSLKIRGGSVSCPYSSLLNSRLA